MAGAVVAKVESRQFATPPPIIELTAPKDGLVTGSRARLGEPVSPDEHLLEIVDLSQVYAVARVPEDSISRLKVGNLAHIIVSALPAEPFQGTLLRFGTTADSESGTLDVVFEMSNSSGRLRPAMRAEFSIVVATHEDVTAVPVEAVQGTPSNRYVFVKDFDLPNTFIKAPVETGMRNGRFIEIVAGLFPGDEVVTKGAYPLAFAGAGSISLRDALDAAHGHEHNEDGSELTAEQKAETAQAADGEEHNHGHTSGLTLFLGVLSALLFVLLVLVSLKKKGIQLLS